MEGVWAIFKRSYHGTHHSMSPKHLQRYANERAGRLNMRFLDTVDQMTTILRGMEGKDLSMKKLAAGGPAFPDIRNYDRPVRHSKYIGRERRGGSNRP